jgi:hypothetical protein
VPVSVTEAFRIRKKKFAATGALDALLDMDSRLFIDPHLLAAAKTPELEGAHETFRNHFRRLLKVLRLCPPIPDDGVLWRTAHRLLEFPEVSGICIGYGKDTIAGNGIGYELRSQVLATAKTIVDAGIADPELFEILGLFEEGIGADRISDMTAKVIRHHLYEYSQRVFRDLDIKRTESIEGKYSLPRNPEQNRRTPVILVPLEILRPLPMALDWGDADEILYANAALRAKVNELIGNTWKRAARLPKDDLKGILLENPDLLKDVLRQYKEKPAAQHDFETSPLGAAILYSLAAQWVKDEPLDLELRKKTGAEVHDICLAICKKFTSYLELHATKLLYKPNGLPHREEVAQLLFYLVADAYCEANDLDLSPESDAGRGPVDFKISNGYRTRVNIETKLSSNKKLLHGYETQLAEYNRAEDAYAAIYVVIDVGTGGKWLENLTALRNRLAEGGKQVPDIIVIDGKLKPSASKM